MLHSFPPWPIGIQIYKKIETTFERKKESSWKVKSELHGAQIIKQHNSTLALSSMFQTTHLFYCYKIYIAHVPKYFFAGGDDI